VRFRAGTVFAGLAASVWMGSLGCGEREASSPAGKSALVEPIPLEPDSEPRGIEVVELGRPGGPTATPSADALWAVSASLGEPLERRPSEPGEKTSAPRARNAATDRPPSPLAETLFAAVDTQDSERILDAIAALEELGGQTAIDTLSKILGASGNTDAKVEALDALAFLADEGDVHDALRTALTDPSPLVRMEAADITAELLLVELLPDLRAAEAQESDPEAADVMSDAVFEIEIEEEITP
jgi:hypothetical protein